MIPSPKYFDPRTIAKLRTLELRARWIVDGYLAGRHRSPLRGFSNEFAEHREYTPGDDWRHVDWKVFGRTDKYYLKQFQDESNLICYLLLDVSDSMNYRGPDSSLSKLDYARCWAASLAWLTLHRRDAVGLITFDDLLRSWIEPASTPAALPSILAALEVPGAVSKSQVATVLHDVARRLVKKGIIIVLSDFFDNLDEVVLGLKHLRHARHDTHAIQIVDPAELEFPFQRTTLFRGLEGAGQLVVDGAAIGDSYRVAMRSFCDKLRGDCRASEIAFTQVSTASPYDWSLSQFLTSRRTRSA